MAKILEGHLVAKGVRFALLATRTNDLVVRRLVSGAEDCIARHGGEPENVTLVRIPGSWELPFAAKRAAESGRFDAVVALGALIRGETPHFDVLAAEAARGLAAVASASGVPISFGVLTCDTLEQATERAGAKAGNKGWDAALAAIEMVDLLRRME